MMTILLFGMLVGVQHALEADHLAAVSALASHGNSMAGAARQGAVWGMGHSLTLFLFGGSVLLMEQTVPEHYTQFLEMAVGVMLIILGLDVIRRVIRNRVHFHFHKHDASVHFHAHSHQKKKNHAEDPHQHTHPEEFPMRALLVGMTHGLAGSAALVVLAVGAVSSPLQGLLYMLLFGVGSVLGMALLAVAISLPFHYYSARGLTLAHNGLQLAAGSVTLGLGCYLVYSFGFGAGLLL
ncbi:MAG: urease accessory protein [Gammaproteobacteria bacterium]|nr:urease accessory protein [Gammaproteobacteria bacterium]